MKLTAVEKEDTCLNGDFVFTCRFDGPWEKEKIEKLAELGTLTYHGDFPRPMFQVRSAAALIKGLEAACEFRLIFSRDCTGEERENFRKRLAGIAGG